MLAVDEKGREINGDILIAMFAVSMKKRELLKSNAVAVTTMTNMGFFEAMKNNGIECSVTDVGDKYVLRRMLEEGISIGGERSGHIIFGDISTTGDGPLSAIKLLELLSEERKPLSECAAVMEDYPLILIGSQVPASYKQKYKDDAVLNNAIAKAAETLGTSGRIIVRASGTEPLIRVMVEGKNPEQIKEIAQSLVGVIDLNSAK
jgi:phosphoglucosamine mutase